MEENLFEEQNQEWLEIPLENIKKYPEFYLYQGDLLDRLAHFCFYNVGSFQYPVRSFLEVYITEFLTKTEIESIYQEINFQIIIKPVYEIYGDGAIMSQDINRIVGPIVDAEFADGEVSMGSIEDLLKELENFQPSKIGDVLVSSPNWCKAKYLLELVVYHFEDAKISDKNIIKSALYSSFQKAEELKINRLVLETLGTEFKVLNEQEFIEILFESLVDLCEERIYLNEVVIAAQNKKQAKILQNAIINLNIA